MRDALKSFFLQPFSLKNYFEDCLALAVLLLKLLLSFLPALVVLLVTAAVLLLLSPIVLLMLSLFLLAPIAVFLLFLR
jgi:hypothetical protein